MIESLSFAGLGVLIFLFFRIRSELNFMKSCLDDDNEAAMLLDEEIDRLDEKIDGLKCDIECLHNDIVTLKRSTTNKKPPAKKEKKK